MEPPASTAIDSSHALQRRRKRVALPQKLPGTGLPRAKDDARAQQSQEHIAERGEWAHVADGEGLQNRPVNGSRTAAKTSSSDNGTNAKNARCRAARPLSARSSAAATDLAADGSMPDRTVDPAVSRKRDDPAINTANIARSATVAHPRSQAFGIEAGRENGKHRSEFTQIHGLLQRGQSRGGELADRGRNPWNVQRHGERVGNQHAWRSTTRMAMPRRNATYSHNTCVSSTRMPSCIASTCPTPPLWRRRSTIVDRQSCEGPSNLVPTDADPDASHPRASRAAADTCPARTGTGSTNTCESHTRTEASAARTSQTAKPTGHGARRP